jgi:hypothetical protein
MIYYPYFLLLLPVPHGHGVQMAGRDNRADKQTADFTSSMHTSFDNGRGAYSVITARRYFAARLSMWSCGRRHQKKPEEYIM